MSLGTFRTEPVLKKNVQNNCRDAFFFSKLAPHQLWPRCCASENKQSIPGLYLYSIHSLLATDCTRATITWHRNPALPLVETSWRVNCDRLNASSWKAADVHHRWKKCLLRPWRWFFITQYFFIMILLE